MLWASVCGSSPQGAAGRLPTIGSAQVENPSFENRLSFSTILPLDRNARCSRSGERRYAGATKL